MVTTINPLYTATELHRQLQDAGATFLVTIPQFLEKAREAVAGTGVREVFVFGAAEGATPFAALPSAGPPPAVAIDPREDIVALPYSSGTTGLPKGVMLTHRNLVANVVQTDAVERLTPRETMIGLLPFYHIYGMVVLMSGALRVGATVVTMPRFDFEQFSRPRAAAPRDDELHRAADSAGAGQASGGRQLRPVLAGPTCSPGPRRCRSRCPARAQPARAWRCARGTA